LVFFQISLADGPGLNSLVFSLCPQNDPSTSMAFPLRLYCVPKATPRRSSATQMRLCSSLRFYGDSKATIASLLRCCCDFGDSHGPNQDSARIQSFCDCFVHVQNIRRRSATLCVLVFLATTSLRPCCVHGDCAASWVVARSQ